MKNSIAANKDIIEDFGRAIKATAESRSKLLFNQSAKPYLASLKWNIGHMRSRIRNIKNMS
ncbi:hypothetical protein HN859_05335 [Candidatus Parcubacteria bacterium]|nr:hypothetical protein [Candidatus Parcubacteria bacterium]